MHRHERGQVLPLLTVVIVVAGVASLAAGKVGGRAVEEAQAATAADAAALAGAAAGAEAAAAAAEANGARLTWLETAGADTRASVSLGRSAAASARARRSAAADRGVPAPALRAALARAAQLAGGPVPTVPPSPDGPAPGDSAARHERGLAVDVPPSFVPALLPAAAGAGLCRPYPETHPTHFELCPPPAPRLP